MTTKFEVATRNPALERTTHPKSTTEEYLGQNIHRTEYYDTQLVPKM